MKALKYMGFVLTLSILAVVLQHFKAPPPASPEACNLTGKITKVSDGDSVELKDETGVIHKIRLAGIDAPEYNQAYGRAAKTLLASLIDQQTLCIEWNKIDRYKRLVGKLWYQGRDVNLQLVEAGLAWHYKYYEDEQSAVDRKRYAQAEQQAKAAKTGLWQSKKTIAPWDWRTGER